MRRIVLAKALKLAAICAFPILSAACATNGPATIEGECRIFRPLTSSTRDTAQTRQGIVEHNAAGKAGCGWKPPARPASV